MKSWVLGTFSVLLALLLWSVCLYVGQTIPDHPTPWECVEILWVCAGAFLGIFILVGGVGMAAHKGYS